jgi:hypothetical protein
MRVTPAGPCRRHPLSLMRAKIHARRITLFMQSASSLPPGGYFLDRPSCGSSQVLRWQPSLGDECATCLRSSIR